ncbi:hypothetical protein B0A52_09677 [Exophiala mesophila]|uniref:UBA domain-containing protein n=1 Tax=Exophiala mesophila TaxID=212818 RepID=A0A438MS36_EXOME|nr:hypothetical protein B0A52_09677 [Exophiala mesophila]
MDDIAGLKWDSNAGNAHKPPTSNYSAFTSLKPTPPPSGRASPFPVASSKPPSKPATPSNDSFASLVAFSSGPSKNLSLQEQQKRLLESKLLQQQAKDQAAAEQFQGGDDAFWNNFGSGRGTPAVVKSPPLPDVRSSQPVQNDDDDDDLFAAFNQPATGVKASTNGTVQKKALVEDGDDDDPFGLSELTSRGTKAAETNATIVGGDDDDVLGLLGKPVSSVRPLPKPSGSSVSTSPADMHPQDKAIAELVDMGFPADRAKQALESTGTGLDVQAAVGYLLNQAHSEAQERARGQDRSKAPGRNVSRESEARSLPGQQLTYNERRNRQDHEQIPASYRAPEKDFERMAGEFGNQLLKSAGSFWKQSTKRVHQVVQDFGSDSEPGAQPRWMRDTERRHIATNNPQTTQFEDPGSRRRSPRNEPASHVTDEALMLESSRPITQRREPKVEEPYHRFGDSRGHSPNFSQRPAEPTLPLREAPSKQPAFLRPSNSPPITTTRSSLNRQAAEEQAAQAYTSSARRRKPQPTPDLIAQVEPHARENGSQVASSRNKPAAVSERHQQRPPQSALTRVETPVNPPAPARNIPPISAISLKAVHTHREQGNAHFQRGDYSAAHQSYATSITHIPAAHPLLIVLLTNHALTALKTGEPKVAITDADKAIAIIGVSRGESESIDLGSNTSSKRMRDYYGKALMRKAEALEQMEKWAEAAAVWRLAVEGGHGGSTSIQGRLRAEKAASPTTQKPASAGAKRSAVSAPRRPAPARNSPAPATAAAAVTRLRAANLAAEKADEEKFRLGDSVDARVYAWKNGKADNLRALLGSLENVLWEGSGWKKVSMADLVLPQKVKIQYMKGIAKVHPDKIPTDATTEQRMIAGSVFSTLNEAWDKFKAENGL